VESGRYVRISEKKRRRMAMEEKMVMRPPERVRL
jgi:hypothetical protein